MMNDFGLSPGFGFCFFSNGVVIDGNCVRLPPPPLKGGVSAVTGFDFGDFWLWCRDRWKLRQTPPYPPLKGGVGFVIQLDFGDFQD
jgi:hypothetical protein